MKYELERLGPDNFEHLIQSLIRGIAGNSAIIFGSGADGQREAVIENANLMICNDSVHGRTVVQAKFKGPDTKQGDWDWLRKNLKDELEGFKEKSTSHPHIVPVTFLFFTNIVLTPVLDSGIRDRAEKFVVEYKDIIPNIIIFGADDIRTMLEGNGRTQRLYFRQLAQRAGYKLDFASVDSDRMMIATIHAASGVEETLHNLFEEIVTP